MCRPCHWRKQGDTSNGTTMGGGRERACAGTRWKYFMNCSTSTTPASFFRACLGAPAAAAPALPAPPLLPLPAAAADAAVGEPPLGVPPPPAAAAAAAAARTSLALPEREGCSCQRPTTAPPLPLARFAALPSSSSSSGGEGTCAHVTVLLKHAVVACF